MIILRYLPFYFILSSFPPSTWSAEYFSSLFDWNLLPPSLFIRLFRVPFIMMDYKNYFKLYDHWFVWHCWISWSHTLELAFTVSCSQKQPKQKIPFSFSFIAYKLTIRDFKSVEKNIPQQCPLGVTSKAIQPQWPGRLNWLHWLACYF